MVENREISYEEYLKSLQLEVQKLLERQDKGEKLSDEEMAKIEAYNYELRKSRLK